MSAKLGMFFAAFLVAGSTSGISLAANDGAGQNRSGQTNCKIIERAPSAAHQSGRVSTSVTAGNGQVTAHSSGGQGVTVHSDNGSVSSSVASTTGSGGGSTTVTHADGTCTIYVTPDKKEDN